MIAITVVGFACSSGFAQAQSSKFGAYSGTINVSGTEIDPQVTYRASDKVNLPVTQRDSTSATAEFLAGEAPDATVLISQWDASFTEKSADSDGKIQQLDMLACRSDRDPHDTDGRPQRGSGSKELRSITYLIANQGHCLQLQAFTLRRIQEKGRSRPVVSIAVRVIEGATLIKVRRELKSPG